MDGGVTAAWVPEAAAFGGLLAGFLVGLLPCLLARRQPAVAPVEAGAL
jgi:hypothetical protein